LWVDAAATVAAATLRPGTRVEAVGFAARRAGVSLLEDASFQPLGPAPLPAAAAVTADQALSGAFHARLVRMDALVLEVSRLAEGSTLVLQAGERVFLARLTAAGAAGENQPDLPVAENSWVRVTGVCVNNRPPDAGDATDAGGGDADVRPVSFHVMLPGPEAVAVVRAPSWWTLERVLVVIGVLVLAALAALAWVVALRRRVVEQTVQIRRHVHQETVNEERMRIARELHDSLEQDLLGITLQLNATEKLLDRPDRAKESLHLASAMVRRSQAETHRAVWDLRERQTGLVPTLRSAVAGLTGGAGTGGGANGEGPAVEVRVDGEERELPPQTENHLLRVALEAVTNAFKHAAATRVTVDVTFEPNRVRLEVRDDGRGFDADRAPAPSSGHFGLFGMRERADKLRGELSIQSRPGAGTDIRLVVPVPASGAGPPPSDGADGG
jgi:signal transduction histidine kinase